VLPSRKARSTTAQRSTKSPRIASSSTISGVSGSYSSTSFAPAGAGASSDRAGWGAGGSETAGVAAACAAAGGTGSLAGTESEAGEGDAGVSDEDTERSNLRIRKRRPGPDSGGKRGLTGHRTSLYAPLADFAGNYRTCGTFGAAASTVKGRCAMLRPTRASGQGIPTRSASEGVREVSDSFLPSPPALNSFSPGVRGAAVRTPSLASDPQERSDKPTPSQS